VCALALGLRVRAEPQAVRAVAPWIAAAGGAAALPGVGSDGGSFGNARLLAGFLSLSLVYTLGPLGAGNWSWTGGPWARLAWLLAAGLQVAALIRCQSLGSWLALAVGLGACTAVRLLQRGRRRLVGLAGLVALAAALGIGVHPPLTVRDHVQGRLHLCRT